MKKPIILTKAVQPIGPYSHAVFSNGFIFVSGQGPVDPETGESSETFEGQAHQVFKNLQTIVDGCGASMENVIKINAYLSDLEYFQKFNEIYKMYFPSDFPARTTVQAGLLGILIEIDCVAEVTEQKLKGME